MIKLLNGKEVALDEFMTWNAYKQNASVVVSNHDARCHANAKRWLNPAFKEKMLNHLKEIRSDPETVEKRRTRSIEHNKASKDARWGDVARHELCTTMADDFRSNQAVTCHEFVRKWLGQVISCGITPTAAFCIAMQHTVKKQTVSQVVCNVKKSLDL